MQALAVLIIAILSFAFQPAFGDTCPDCVYTRQVGDHYWLLTWNGDPQTWDRILAENPFLMDMDRPWAIRDDSALVLTKQGESIDGLEELGVTQQRVIENSPFISEPDESKPLGLSETKIPFGAFLGLMALLVTSIVGLQIFRILYGGSSGR